MTTNQAITPDAAAALFRHAPDRLIDVGEGSVAMRSVGRGPDVLFVHGWPLSGASFRTLLPHLAPHVTCHVIDLVGSGHSRFDREATIDPALHMRSIVAALDAIGSQSLAVVGFDSGGLFARHAIAGDERIRALGLIGTEQPQGLTVRVKQFLWMAKLPGFGRMLGYLAGRRRLRRNKFVFGDIFFDRDLLDGDFEELLLAPLSRDADKQWAAEQLARRWDTSLIDELADLHQRITCPVHLVWGAEDPFFPVARAREMVSTFPDAVLTEIEGAKLCAHEDKPREVAEALLRTIA